MFIFSEYLFSVCLCSLRLLDPSTCLVDHPTQLICIWISFWETLRIFKFYEVRIQGKWEVLIFSSVKNIGSDLKLFS